MTSQQGKFHFLKDQSVNMFDVEIHLDSYVCSGYISNYFLTHKISTILHQISENMLS